MRFVAAATFLGGAMAAFPYLNSTACPTNLTSIVTVTEFAPVVTSFINSVVTITEHAPAVTINTCAPLVNPTSASAFSFVASNGTTSWISGVAPTGSETSTITETSTMFVTAVPISSSSSVSAVSTSTQTLTETDVVVVTQTRTANESSAGPLTSASVGDTPSTITLTITSTLRVALASAFSGNQTFPTLTPLGNRITAAPEVTSPVMSVYIQSMYPISGNWTPGGQATLPSNNTNQTNPSNNPNAANGNNSARNGTAIQTTYVNVTRVHDLTSYRTPTHLVSRPAYSGPNPAHGGWRHWSNSSRAQATAASGGSTTSAPITYSSLLSGSGSVSAALGSVTANATTANATSAVVTPFTLLNYTKV